MVKVFGFILIAWFPALLAAAANRTACSFHDIAAAGQRVILLCDEGQLLVSDDQGANWQPRPLPSESKFRALAFVDSRRGFVVGDKGTLLATEDGGNSWKPVKAPTAETLTDVHFVGESGWIAGFSGVMLHTTDGGRTWAKQDTGVTQALDSVFFLDANHGWAVGWIGTVVRTTDGGKTWQRTPISMAWSMSSVYFRDVNNGWIVGFAGQILRSRDGGATWQAQKSPINAWLTSLQFDKAGRGWITADNALLVSEDSGESWRLVDVPETPFLLRLLRVNDTLWAVGQYAVLRQTSGGKQWESIQGLQAVTQASTAASQP
jgi:photosystem II stability/assembly factor-like uncharacterized protein